MAGWIGEYDDKDQTCEKYHHTDKTCENYDHTDETYDPTGLENIVKTSTVAPMDM